MSKYTIYFDDNTYLEVETDKIISRADVGYIALLDEKEEQVGLIMTHSIQAIILSDAINPEDNERLEKKNNEPFEGERKETNSEALEQFYYHNDYEVATKTT